MFFSFSLAIIALSVSTYAQVPPNAQFSTLTKEVGDVQTARSALGRAKSRLSKFEHNVQDAWKDERDLEKRLGPGNWALKKKLRNELRERNQRRRAALAAVVNRRRSKLSKEKSDVVNTAKVMF